jgi:hypothetical protein
VAFVAGMMSSSRAHAVETELLTVVVMDQDLVPTLCVIQMKNDVSDEVRGPENAVHFGEATGVCRPHIPDLDRPRGHEAVERSHPQAAASAPSSCCSCRR